MRAFKVGGNQGRGDPARVPITLADDEGTLADNRPSMLSRRWFWIAAVASALLWALADVLLSVYWPH